MPPPVRGRGRGGNRGGYAYPPDYYGYEDYYDYYGYDYHNYRGGYDDPYYGYDDFQARAEGAAVVAAATGAAGEEPLQPGEDVAAPAAHPGAGPTSPSVAGRDQAAAGGAQEEACSREGEEGYVVRGVAAVEILSYKSLLFLAEEGLGGVREGIKSTI
ncbi:hypothetical protein INR49_018409 [Caranx melampygus]|nr:hypothetical protein INR49_018409 [Caranx melampygus]